MTRIANIRVERCEKHETSETAKRIRHAVADFDDQQIMRVVLTKPSYRGNSRALNVYILTDPVAEEEVFVDTCSRCGHPITKVQSWINDHGVISHNNPADCFVLDATPDEDSLPALAPDATADSGSGTAPEPTLTDIVAGPPNGVGK